MTRVALALSLLCALGRGVEAQTVPRDAVDQGPRPATPAKPVETVYYGGYILVAELGVVAAAGLSETDEVAIAAYVFGGPIVHLAHGNAGRAAGSFALRLGLPAGGAVMGAAMTGCDDGEYVCRYGGAAGGLMLGVVAASIIDATLLARESRPVQRSPRSGALQLGDVSATPTVTRTRAGGWTFGLTGAF